MHTQSFIYSTISTQLTKHLNASIWNWELKANNHNKALNKYNNRITMIEKKLAKVKRQISRNARNQNSKTTISKSHVVAFEVRMFISWRLCRTDRTTTNTGDTGVPEHTGRMSTMPTEYGRRRHEVSCVHRPTRIRAREKLGPLDCNGKMRNRYFPFKY